MKTFWPLFDSKSSKIIPLLRMTLSTRTCWKYLSSSRPKDSNEVSRGNTKQGRQNDGQKKSGFHLRLATEDDFPQNVEELSKGIYDGEDYIPLVFHDWLTTSNKLMFLAELHGKAVGFDVVNILSDGKTVMRQALRVHLEYRERGLFHQINSNVENYVRQMYPQVSKQHYVVKCSNTNMIKIASKLGHEKTGKSTWHTFDVQKTSSLLPLVTSRCQMLLEQTAQHLYPYDTNIAAAMIDRGNALHCIAPQKMMFRDWQPYEAIPANIEHLFKEDDQMFADISPQELLQGGKIPSSFSHGCLSPRVRALFWTCTVYANDIESFRAHVLRQLEAATARITDQDFALCVDVHSKISSTSMDERRVLEEELQRLHQNHNMKREEVILFEGVFDVDKKCQIK